MQLKVHYYIITDQTIRDSNLHSCSYCTCRGTKETQFLIGIVFSVPACSTPNNSGESVGEFRSWVWFLQVSECNGLPF
jgi:hypothetical protein